MRLSRCVRCDLPVLELEGQFDNLDSFYIEDGEPPPATAGSWHALCLAESDVGSAWYEARLRNHRDVRGYQEIAVTPHWVIMRDRNRGKVLALGRHGDLLSLSRGNRASARAVRGGVIFPKVEEFHLELDDEGLLQRIRTELVATGSFPLPVLLHEMGISHRMVHADALQQGALRFDRELQAHWRPRFVSFKADYGVFVPSELEAHVGELIR